MKRPDLQWSELHFVDRPHEADVRALLEHVASAGALGVVAFEARATNGAVRYLVGSDEQHHTALQNLIATHLAGTRTSTLKDERKPVCAALAVNSSNNNLPLRTNVMEPTTRAILAALASVTSDEELVLQLVLGERLLPVYDELPRSRYTDVLGVLSGRPVQFDPNERTQHRAKRGLHGFRGSVRLGARAATESRAQGLLRAALGALRTLEPAGLRLDARTVAVRDLAEAAAPRGLFFDRSGALNSLEAAQLLAWPVGVSVLPGQPPKHPKRVQPPATLRASKHPFAAARCDGREMHVGLSRDDSLTHEMLIGRTGSGKSVLMSHQILGAIADGRSVLVIDPKGDLITSELLPRIPLSRRDDVVVIDPMSELPVGINPFAEKGSPELVADNLLAVFKTVYADSWGPRLEDILSSALLTLARSQGSTLAMLPALLTDPALRRRLTKDLRDPVGLEPFWKAYDAMSPEQRAQVIAPVLNKLRPYLLRSGLRRTLGQAEPRFSLSELFTKRRIVLVNLNKGLLGAEGARLLGSLVVSQLWPLILARAAVPKDKRHVVNVYIDEVQDYLSLPADLASAYAQARGLGVSFAAAFQHRKQLPTALLAGLDSNARSVVTFNLDYDDATAFAHRAPELDAEDFMALGQYEIYATLMDRGTSTGWFLARTLAPTEPIDDGTAVLRRSLERYGRPGHMVDQEIERALGINTDEFNTDGPIGRRPKGGRS